VNQASDSDTDRQIYLALGIKIQIVQDFFQSGYTDGVLGYLQMNVREYQVVLF
jgi:hypothetical protein